MKTQLKLIANIIQADYKHLRRRIFPYRPLGALGPEHEFSLVDEQINPMPISDKVIKSWYGELVDSVSTANFSFGKEIVLHQLEIRAKKPFRSPEIFEEKMQKAVSILLEFVRKKHKAHLLGTGMHPMLTSERTSLWPHSDQAILLEFKKIFNLSYQGWINIQSYQLSLPYYNEAWGVALYNALAHLCAYLPAISASSPICEGKLSPNIDTRLYHYQKYMQEIPSIAGDVIPEYIKSFEQFRREVVGQYSKDLARIGAGKRLLQAEWLNQRGAIFKFFRSAIEVRIMDEQECIKSDVALSCFIRAAIRGLIARNEGYPPHQLLVNDYHQIVKSGLKARVQHPQGTTAKEVCQYLLNIASEHAKPNEKKYLWIVKKRIEEGNLSEIIRRRVLAKAQKTCFNEAIRSVYTKLVEALSKNQPYF